MDHDDSSEIQKPSSTSQENINESTKNVVNIQALPGDVGNDIIMEESEEPSHSDNQDAKDNPHLHELCEIVYRDNADINKDNSDQGDIEKHCEVNRSVSDASQNVSVQPIICNPENRFESQDLQIKTTDDNVIEPSIQNDQMIKNKATQKSRVPYRYYNSIAQALLECQQKHTENASTDERKDNVVSEESSVNITCEDIQPQFESASKENVTSSIRFGETHSEAYLISTEKATPINPSFSPNPYNATSFTPSYSINDARYILSSESTIECIGSASTCFQGGTDNNNFLKGCKWSPDGTQIVTNSNDNFLRIFTPEGQMSQTSMNLNPSCVIREKSQVYDFCWYPGSSSSSSDSSRVASTCSGIPIHLWDSSNGETVASYRAYDHCDEIIAAYSLAFSPDGSKLFAGYKKSIRIFDTERPGRTSRLLKTYDCRSKEGVSGIISCFAFSQDASPVFVVGSYSRHVGVYDYASQQLIYMMQGQAGGVTHVMLSPDGTKLYTGARKDPEIVCWDMRNTGHVLFTCLRDVQTNQRMYFDLSESGQYLVCGNHDGSVNVYNTLDPGETIEGDVILKPRLTFLAHQDCVNGVSLTHQQGILATTSGQRHFIDFDDSGSDSSSMSIDDNTNSRFDNSLKFWKIPCHTEDS